MRKLSDPEIKACRFLLKHGPYTPGDAALAKGGPEVLKVLRSLVKKGRATADMSDDGPTFMLTKQGEADGA